MRVRAVSVLKAAFEEPDKWTKMHAAEALMWNGYPNGIKDAFADEIDNADAQYKIAIWDILARTAGNDKILRRDYIDKIYEAVVDNTGQVRNYALEKLIKFRYSKHLDELRKIGEGRLEILKFLMLILLPMGHYIKSRILKIMI